MKYQLTVERRFGGREHVETHVFGTLEQAKRAAARRAETELVWQPFVNPMTGDTVPDKLNGHAGELYFEIDPFE